MSKVFDYIAHGGSEADRQAATQEYTEGALARAIEIAQELEAENERLRADLDLAVVAVRRWHKTALAMRDMSITGNGDIQNCYFDAAMSIPFYGADGEPLPSQRAAINQQPMTEPK